MQECIYLSQMKPKLCIEPRKHHSEFTPSCSLGKTHTLSPLSHSLIVDVCRPSKSQAFESTPRTKSGIRAIHVSEFNCMVTSTDISQPKSFLLETIPCVHSWALQAHQMAWSQMLMLLNICSCVSAREHGDVIEPLRVFQHTIPAINPNTFMCGICSLFF